MFPGQLPQGASISKLNFLPWAVILSDNPFLLHPEAWLPGFSLSLILVQSSFSYEIFPDHHTLKWASAAWVGGKFGAEWIHAYVWLSLSAVRLKVFTLLIDYVLCCAQSLSCGQLFATPRTVGCQSPLSMGLSRQEHWSGLPFPPPGDLPHPGIEPTSIHVPASKANPLLLSPQGSPLISYAPISNKN